MAQKHAMRGQAATEFFINYGWAIVIVLAIMAVLYSTVFKPEFYVAERCDIAPGITCDNFKLEKVDSGHVKLTLQAHNTMGFSINVTRINFTLNDPMGGEGTNSSIVTVFGPLGDGDSFTAVPTFDVGSVAVSGTLYKIRFSATFTDNEVSPVTTHRTAGVINVRIS